MATVFVYGTLTECERVDTLLPDWRFDDNAVLMGLHREDGIYPTLVPGGRTPGRLLVTSALDQLDRYEDVDSGRYVRVRVPTVDGVGAWVYVGDPDRLDAPGHWPGTGPFPERVRAWLDATDVMIRRSDNR